MKSQKEEPLKKVRVSVVREHYEMQLSSDWMQRKFDSMEANPALGDALFSLLAEWRAIAITGAMPAKIIDWLADYMNAYSNASPTKFACEAKASLINQQILELVPELAGNDVLFEKIISAIKKVTFEVQSTSDQLKIEINRDRLWKDFLAHDDPSFPMMLYSSQRVCFVAYYNAYECFLVDVLKELSGSASLRMSNKKQINPLIKEHFGGDDGFGKCWGNSELNIARLTRHSFAHAGGKLTEDLKKVKHGLIVQGGVIQIPVEYNIKLLQTLRAGVDHICSHLS
ncbi:MAG: hypothetical protein AAFN77_20730 [Planctomycetota bacterium]